jgi:hypothetical protein
MSVFIGHRKRKYHVWLIIYQRTIGIVLNGSGKKLKKK